MCTTDVESQKMFALAMSLTAVYWQYLHFVGRPLKPSP